MLGLFRISSSLDALRCKRVQPCMFPSFLSPEVDPLEILIQLNPCKEQDRFDKHNSPFPRNGRVAEHIVVDHGDIDEREDQQEARYDGPEEELVPPHIVHPLREVFFGFGLHPEEAAAHVDHFPREEKSKPGQAGECCGASTEHRVTFGRVMPVAASSKIAVAKGEHNEREGG